MANWLMVASEDSFKATLERGLLGFYGDERGYRLISQTSVGDRIVFYITRKKVAQGLVRVESAPFLDESPLYGDARDASWNQRVKVSVLEADKSAMFPDLAKRLEFVKNKSVSYSAYFTRTLVQLSDGDFNAIIQEMGLRS